MTWAAWPFGFFFSPTAMEAMAKPLVQGVEENTVVYVDDITVVTGSFRSPRTVADVEAHVAACQRVFRNCKRHSVFLAVAKAQVLSARLTV